jgi:signal transduction histidine kinase
MTKARECCTFVWSQDPRGLRRTIFVRRYHCAACVGEMVRSARLQKVAIAGSVPMEPVREILSRSRAEIIDRWSRQLLAASEAGFALDGETATLLPALLDKTDAALERRFRPPVPGAPRVAAEASRAATQCSLLSDFLFDAVVEKSPGIGAHEQHLLREALAHAGAEVAVRVALEHETERRRKDSARFARLAHDLRDSMTAAQLSLDLLRRRGVPLDNGPGRALERSLRQLRHGLEDSLLDEALSAGGLRLARVQLGALLEAASGAASELGAGEKQLRVLHQRGPLIEVSADPRLVRPAVRGMLRAAFELSRKGATVRLQGGRARAFAQVEIVVDRCKVPPRLSSIPALSLARRAAKAHGGKISARPFPRDGCVFTLALPAAPA